MRIFPIVKKVAARGDDEWSGVDRVRLDISERPPAPVELATLQALMQVRESHPTASDTATVAAGIPAFETHPAPADTHGLDFRVLDLHPAPAESVQAKINTLDVHPLPNDFHVLGVSARELQPAPVESHQIQIRSLDAHPAPSENAAIGTWVKEAHPSPLDNIIVLGSRVLESHPAPVESGLQTVRAVIAESNPVPVDLATLIQLETSPAPKYPGNASQNATVGLASWANITNIRADDGANASVTVNATNGVSSQVAWGSNFSLMEEEGGLIPADAEILRVTAEFEFSVSVTDSLTANQATVTMRVDSGTVARLTGTYQQADNTSSPMTVRSITTGGDATNPQTVFTRDMLTNAQSLIAVLQVALPVGALNAATVNWDFARLIVWWRKTFTA